MNQQMMPSCPKCNKNTNVKEKDETHPTKYRCNACQQNFNDVLLRPAVEVEIDRTKPLRVKRPSLLNLK